MPHFGQFPGFVDVTSGCIGHAYTSSLVGAASGDGVDVGVSAIGADGGAGVGADIAPPP